MTKKDDYRPSMAERSIGRTVRLWRNQRGLSLAAAGELLGFSSAKLSMIENALRPTVQTEIIALGLTYRVKCDEWKQLAERAARETNKRADDASALNAAEDFEDVCLEVSALRASGTDVLCQLLQSQKYLARIDCDGDPLRTEALVTEDAIRHAVRKSATTGSTLLNVVRLAERERLKVCVLTGDELPLEQPSLLLLSFPNKQHHDVVLADGSYIDHPRACQLASQAFDALLHSALEPQRSIDVIAELIEEAQR